MKKIFFCEQDLIRVSVRKRVQDGYNVEFVLMFGIKGEGTIASSSLTFRDVSFDEAVEKVLYYMNLRGAAIDAEGKLIELPLIERAKRAIEDELRKNEIVESHNESFQAYVCEVAGVDIFIERSKQGDKHIWYVDLKTSCKKEDIEFNPETLEIFFEPIEVDIASIACESREEAIEVAAKIVEKNLPYKEVFVPLAFRDDDF